MLAISLKSQERAIGFKDLQFFSPQRKLSGEKCPAFLD